MALKNGFFKVISNSFDKGEYFLVYHNKVYDLITGSLSFDDSERFKRYLYREGKNLKFSTTLPSHFKPGLDKINDLLGTRFTLSKY